MSKRTISKSPKTTRTLVGKITKAQQILMARRARRISEIATGIRSVCSGTGAWGGTKKQRKRKERRLGKRTANNYTDG